MKRSELRRLIVEELNGISEGGFFSGGFSGGNHGDTALTTGQVMDQMRGSDVEKEMSVGHGFRDAQDARPLETNELFALMMADKDSNSDYKLSMERLQTLNYGNLTVDELEIVNK
jgi:hypothetical protein